MSEPEKPFACIIPDCRMTFTNEDHLNVHTKKHDMVLQLGLEQKGATFVADQTPTPTRFIRNCEEVGLFQDLQNVNPFDETFKRAMEARSSIALENALSGHDDALHTPHIFPNLTVETPSTIYNGATDLRTNMTIHRSTSEETPNLTAKCLTSLDRNISSDLDPKIIDKQTLDGDNIKSDNINTGTGNKNHGSNTNVTTVTDSVVTMNIINNTNYEIRHGMLDSKSISENEKMLLKSNQIPVISITETSELGSVLITTEEDSSFQNTSVSVIKKDVMLTATSKNNDMHLGNEIKKNYLELVSQKSLDMAIDSLNSLKHDHKIMEDDGTSTESNSAEKYAKLSDARNNFKIVLTNVTETVDSTITKDKRHKQELPNQLIKKVETHKPVLRGLKRKSASKDKEIHSKQKIVQNGQNKPQQSDQYEILLKLPGGQTVHMKSVDEANTGNQSRINVKSVLRTALSSKVNEKNEKNVAVNRNCPIVVNNANHTGNLIVSGSNTPVQLCQMMPNSANVLFPTTPQYITKEKKDKNVAVNRKRPILVNNANQTGNLIVSGGNTPVQICQMMPNSANVLYPTTPQYISIGNTNLNVAKQAFLSPVPILIQNPNLASVASLNDANVVSSVPIPKTYDGVRNTVEFEKDTGGEKAKCKVSFDLQHRRNAVKRYRARQKLKRAQSAQHHQMLRTENECLSLQLAQAQLEIERLASIVNQHRSCLPVMTDREYRNHQSQNSIARIVELKNGNVTITSNITNVIQNVASNHTYVNNPNSDETRN